MNPLRRQAEGHHTRRSVTTKECGALGRVPLSLFVVHMPKEKKKKIFWEASAINYLALLIQSTTWIAMCGKAVNHLPASSAKA